MEKLIDMKQQTAVEWLWNTLIDTYNLEGISPGQEHLPDGMLSYLEQAKQMEKEQMIDLIRFLRTQDKMGKSVEDLYEQYKKK